MENKIKKPRLANVKAMSITSPDRCHYWEEEIAQMKIGDLVKIANNYERFWVIVKEITDKYITGEVNNFLVMSPNLEQGDLLYFKRENIYEVWDVDEYADYLKKVK